VKTITWLVVAIIIIGGGFYLLNSYLYDTTPAAPTETVTESPVQVTPISHATALLTWGETSIYTDPTGGTTTFAGAPAADIILVTDIHGDHFSTSTLALLVGSSTSLIVPQAVKDLLPASLAAQAKVLANGQTISEQGFQVTGIAMYNLPQATSSPHIKGRGNGYMIEKDGYRVYVAGDTSGTPEMRALTGIDIAFIPMNLPYTMSVEEAADAVLTFKPKQVYPYHYRGQDGLADINRFKSLVNAGDPAIDVVLADWYPAQ